MNSGFPPDKSSKIDCQKGQTYCRYGRENAHTKLPHTPMKWEGITSRYRPRSLVQFFPRTIKSSIGRKSAILTAICPTPGSGRCKT